VQREYLLVTDVDNTLLGDDAALAAFAEWHRRARPYLRLALNSGRFFDSVYQSIREAGLPEPDAFIGGVGTDICFPPRGDRLEGWPNFAGRWDPEVICSICGGCEQFALQPQRFQSKYKISYYGYDLDEEFLNELREQLTAAGQAATIVYSSQRDLDVLPAGANKGSAVAHLARHWGIEPSHVIVAGDSGNDLEMFRHGFRGIVVANAHSELKALRDPNVFHASQAYASGVLEGVKHWLGNQ
jgi:mannosylfructose-6-phosphate phosphatase